MRTHVIYKLPNRFYWESSTMMGTLYGESGGRWSVADVERVVDEGDEVLIKPATAWLLRWALDHLGEIKATFAKAD